MNEPNVIINNWTHETGTLAATVKNTLAAAEAFQAQESTCRWEAAKGITGLLDAGLTTREVAERIDRSQSFVTRYARVWRAPRESAGLSDFQEAMIKVRATQPPEPKEDDFWTKVKKEVMAEAMGNHRTFWTINFGPTTLYVRAEAIGDGDVDEDEGEGWDFSLSSNILQASFWGTWRTPTGLEEWAAEQCPGGKLNHEDLPPPAANE